MLIGSLGTTERETMNARKRATVNSLLDIVTIVALVVVIVIALTQLLGCTDPHIHLPRKECVTYTLRDGRTVVVWIGDAPPPEELPVVKDPGVPWPVDEKEFE